MDHVLNLAPNTGAMIGMGKGLPFVLTDRGQVDVMAMRPFLNEQGAPRVITNAQGDMAPTTNATLGHEEWVAIDTERTQVMEERLVAVGDLLSRGLTRPVGFGDTLSLWEVDSDMDPANIDLDIVTRGSNDRVLIKPFQVPVPVVHKSFFMTARQRAASAKNGQPLDVTQQSIASRKVAEASELMLFSGAPIVVGGFPIYGYRTFPTRSQVDLTVIWPNAAPKAILDDVQEMLGFQRINRFFGGNILYIPPEWEGRLDDDYIVGDEEAGLTSVNSTIRERLMRLSGLEEIKVAEKLSGTNEAVMVAMRREAVDMAVAQEATTISWDTHGGWVNHFTTFAIWVPRIKADYDGRTGVVHLRAG